MYHTRPDILHYTTNLMLLQPFIDPGQPVLRLFPPTSSLYLPLSVFITTFIAAVLGYVGWLMVSEPAAPAAAASSRSSS